MDERATMIDDNKRPPKPSPKDSFWRGSIRTGRNKPDFYF